MAKVKINLAIVAAITCLVGLTPSPASAGSLVQFHTGIGTIDVELYEDEKPATVANFLRYVTSGAYSNLYFHRWLPGFVMQGGGQRMVITNNTAFPQNVPQFAPVTNEFSVGRRFSNLFGTIAMARVGGQTNSATTDWFFNVRDNQQLDNVDGGFTVFGRALRGTNVLDRFRHPPGTTNIYFLDNRSEERRVGK